MPAYAVMYISSEIINKIVAEKKSAGISKFLFPSYVIYLSGTLTLDGHFLTYNRSRAWHIQDIVCGTYVVIGTIFFYIIFLDIREQMI